MTLLSNLWPTGSKEVWLDDTVKGIPGGTNPFLLSQIADLKWNVRREDLPFPLLVLKRSALLRNIQIMNTFLQEHQVSIAPHGKTHMSPQLAHLQLASGAWGITAGNVSQVIAFRRAGVQRILLANQLVGRQNIRAIADELNNDATFDFYCLVDSPEGAQHLARLAGQFGLQRQINVLLEIGYNNGRTGCRTVDQARDVLHELRNHRRWLRLAGVEGFEGSIARDNPQEAHTQVNIFLMFLKDFLNELRAEDFPDATELIVSAGGSAYFDMVAKTFEAEKFLLPIRIVLRSGCYLTYDSKMYQDSCEEMVQRGWRGEKFAAAFELWSYVQSIREKGLAILTMGKRDAPYDVYMPTPLRRERGGAVADLSRSEIKRLNDQHAYLHFPEGTDLQFGDQVVCGISHPCTAFDKWRFIPIVDDEYTVVDGIVTYF
jgi:D-serine dehydratase